MPDPAPKILIDADACPVKEEAERVATRHGLRMILVSNGGIRPSAHPLVDYVTFTGSPMTGTAIQQAAGKAQLPLIVEPRIGQSNAITINRQIDDPNAFTESRCVLKIAGDRWIKSAMLQDG